MDFTPLILLLFRCVSVFTRNVYDPTVDRPRAVGGILMVIGLASSDCIVSCVWSNVFYWLVMPDSFIKSTHRLRGEWRTYIVCFFFVNCHSDQAT